jgi:2-polyprenyl-6-methoxyphenol hydroxylase-like FAD-dependent oxidoreductase
MKILIVGAGISGLTLASFLKTHEGFDVDIVDKAKDWSHLGYTLGIWDVGRRILSKLDLDDEFDRASHPIHSYFITDKDNKKVIKLEHFEDYYKKYESVYSDLYRKDLHQMLLTKSGGNIRMGISPESIKEESDKVNVIFSDQSTGIYDLVVGADGLHSKVRELIFPETKIEYTGYRGWYTWIPKKYVPDQTIYEIAGDHALVSLFDNGEQACAYFMARETPGSFCEPTTRIQRLKEHFKHFGSPVLELLNELKAEDLMPSDVGFVNTDTWIDGRVIIIGDAAHAMETFAGIGASVGMEDGYVLADELAQITSDDISKALARYQARRTPRIELARHQTRMNYLITFSPFNFLKRLFAPHISSKHFTHGFKKLLETEA